MSKTTRVQWVDLDSLVNDFTSSQGNAALAVSRNRDWFNPVLDAAYRYAAAVWADCVRWHATRRSEAHLRACSDAVLKDIGIHRSEIASLANSHDRRRTNVVDLQSYRRDS